jgi:hypothetical protein
MLYLRELEREGQQVADSVQGKHPKVVWSTKVESVHTKDLSKVSSDLNGLEGFLPWRYDVSHMALPCVWLPTVETRKVRSSDLPLGAN